MSSLALPDGPTIWDPRMPDGLRDELLFLSTAEHRGGTLYHDDSEREHHATLFDFPSPPPWEHSDLLDRHGLRWDGSNDYVRAANTPFHTTAWTALTMGGWIALDSGQSSPGWAMGFGSSSSNGAHLFYRTAPDTWCWAVGGTERRTNTTFPEDGKLHHIVGVFRAGTMLIYVDGKLDDTDTGPASTGTSIYPWTLGANPAGTSGGNVLNGPIFDPFIYGRDLSGPEIEWIANPAHHFRVPWRRKSWLVGASAAASTSSATAALTASSQTLSGSASFAAGTKTATGELTAAAQTLSASGTFASGTKTATAALTASSQTLSAAALAGQALSVSGSLTPDATTNNTGNPHGVHNGEFYWRWADTSGSSSSGYWYLGWDTVVSEWVIGDTLPGFGPPYWQRADSERLGDYAPASGVTGTATVALAVETFEATAALTASSQTLSASATFAPGTKTATAALEASAQTLAASATHTAPAYTATAALAASAQTLAASGTFAEGVFTATAALESSSHTLAASATYDPGAFTATASLEASSQTLAASAAHTAPEYTATASLTAGSQTLAASATFAAGTFTATAALTAASQTLAANATHTAPTFEATAALETSSQTLAASATFATQTYSATADLGVSAQTLSASATHTAPSFTATAALDATSQTLAASATFGAGAHTATADLEASSQTLAASATHTAPEYSATAALETSSQTLAASGATGEVFLAVAALEASSQTLSASGVVHYKATAALVASSQVLAAAAEAPIVWHADTLRLFDGLTEIRQLAAIGTLPGVVPAHAAARNGPGTARIRYTAAGNLQYRAPGSSTYGAAFPADPLPTNIAALATPSFVLRDGEDADKWLRVEVYADYLPTVATEAEIELADVLANAVSGDHCAAADALAGEVITQEITCTNVGSIVGTDSDITALKFWLTAPAGVTLEISDDGTTWVAPTTEGAALVLGTVAADASVTLHVRRTIAAASDSAASLLAQLHASFTYRGESYYLDARGRFHVFNAAGYYLHWTTDPADPPEEGATPDATAASLPATPADTFADGTHYLAAAAFNGVFASGFYPVGSSGEQYLRLEIVGGAEVGNPPPGPAEVRLEVLASGVVRVHAWFVVDPTDADRPDAWAIGYTTDGLDPAEDTPDATETLTASGLVVLQYDLPAQAHATTVKVRVQTRRNDGTTDTPSWVYSDGSVVYTATADATGPTEALALTAGY